MAEEAQTVRRVKAQSGRASYSDAIVIRNGRDTHLEVLLQYIRHKSGDKLAPKIKFWKKNTAGYRERYPAEFTLTDREARELVQVLQGGLGLAQAGEDGNFLLLRLDGKQEDLPSRRPSDVSSAIAPLLADPKVVDALSQVPNAEAVLHGLESSLRLSQMSLGVEKLEAALRNGVVDEAHYQNWVENYDWAFGNVFVMRDKVRTIALGDQVDALMAATANGLRDVIELKRPNHSVLAYDSDHKSFYWHSDTSKAIGQCHRYMDALHEAARNGLRDHPEIVAYHPRATIVIGRSVDWDQEKLRALHGLNMRLHGMTVMTYDQLLAQANQTLDTFKN